MVLPGRPALLYKGLPEEYAQAIIDGITAHPSLTSFGSGVLSFAWAAHDLARSSYVVFRWLGWGIMQLLLQARHGAAEAEISSLLQLETRPLWEMPGGDEPA